MTTLPDETPASDPDSRVDRDVVVVGGGAAGLSAAVFLARYGLETLVLARGKSAITQCAHVENYLGFPGGIGPERFLELGRTHVEAEGGTVRERRVTAVVPDDAHSPGRFAVETTGETVLADRVVVAAAYDGDILEPLADELDIEPAQSADEEDPFVPTEEGGTAVDGLYVAGWMSDESVHQVSANAGHGARVGVAVAREEMSERYWPAVGDRYVDWVVHDGRYGGEEWADHVEEWFEREMLPAPEGVDEALIERACQDLKAEFLGRCVGADELETRQRRSQRLLLEALDDDVIAEYAESLDSG